MDEENWYIYDIHIGDSRHILGYTNLLGPLLSFAEQRQILFDRVDQFVFQKLRKLTQKRQIEILVEGYDLEN